MILWITSRGGVAIMGKEWDENRVERTYSGYSQKINNILLSISTICSRGIFEVQHGYQSVGALGSILAL